MYQRLKKIALPAASSLHIYLFDLADHAMGGGGGKPQNIFKLDRGIDPPEAFNWRLWFAVFSFGIMGAARGMRYFVL